MGFFGDIFKISNPVESALFGVGGHGGRPVDYVPAPVYGGVATHLASHSGWHPASSLAPAPIVATPPPVVAHAPVIATPVVTPALGTQLTGLIGNAFNPPAGAATPGGETARGASAPAASPPGSAFSQLPAGWQSLISSLFPNLNWR